MKNKVLAKSPKHRNVLFLTFLSAFLFFGCRQEEFTPTPGEDDLQSVKISFSFPGAFETGTEYVPITRAANTRVQIANGYNYIIIEKRPADNKYMVVATGKNKIDPTSILSRVYIEPGTSYDSEITTLRPGDYEILIFNDIPYTQFNAALKPGLILPDKGTPQGAVFAVQYDVNNHYGTSQKKVLFQEVFYGRTSFTVTKTTDLHTPNANKIEMTLERRVGKFRLMLYDDPTLTPTLQELQDTYSEVLFFYLKTHFEMAGGGDFPVGLDVWGDLWYDPDPANAHTEFFHAASPYMHQGLDGENYYITKSGNLTYAPYLFAAPGQSYAIKTQPVSGEIDSNQLMFLQYNGSHPFTIEVNKITGLVLKLDGQMADAYTYTLEPVYDGLDLLDPADLFQSNFEYN